MSPGSGITQTKTKENEPMKYIGYIVNDGVSKQFESCSKEGILAEIKNLLESETQLSEAEVNDACLNVKASDCITIGRISAGLSFELPRAA